MQLIKKFLLSRMSLLRAIESEIIHLNPLLIAFLGLSRLVFGAEFETPVELNRSKLTLRTSLKYKGLSGNPI